MSDSFKAIERPASGIALQEPAPPYDDVVHLFGPPDGASHSSSSGYTSIPQADIEHDAPVRTHHTHNHPSPPLEQPQESLAQTIAGVFRPKPHVHCEDCDRQAERRERLANSRHCCAMVAWVFIMLFFCGMVLGIVIANAAARRARAHHD